MAILWYLLEPDYDPGTGAETITRDLPRQGVTKTLIFDLSAQMNGTSQAATELNLSAQIDRVTLQAVESSKVSEIDGEDLYGFNCLLGNNGPIDVAGAGADNARLLIGFTYPLDPFMLGPRPDYNQNFGIGGNVARKLEILYAADGNDIDSKRTAIGLINNTSQSGSGGYTSFHVNTMQTTADLNDYFDIPQPGRLLGILNFETTEASAVTADAGHRSDQTIEEESITVNRKVQLGPVYTTTLGYFAGQYQLGGLPDDGYSFWDLGIYNTGRLGLPQGSDIPSNMEVKVKRGDATDAGRVYPVTLNTNT